MGLEYLFSMLATVALLAIVHKEDLSENVFSLTTHPVPKSNSTLH